MKLEGYKLIFVTVALVGVLLIATPALADAIHIPSVPGGAKFSELFLLGSNQTAENYPYNIAIDQNYSVYVGVGNQLGYSAYYVLNVKLGNETDQMPNDTLATPSSLQPLYSYRFSIQNSMYWKNLLTFSFSNASISGNNSQLNSLLLNGVTFYVDKPALWDSNNTSFTYRLLFELWIYSTQSNQIEYNNRYVALQLNLTTNAYSG